MIELRSDVNMCFENINLKFISILNERRREFEEIVRKVVSEFDFESAFASHINTKIEEGLEKAFDEIDLSETLKVKIWNEIEKRLGD